MSRAQLLLSEKPAPHDRHQDPLASQTIASCIYGHCHSGRMLAPARRTLTVPLPGRGTATCPHDCTHSVCAGFPLAPLSRQDG